MKKNIAVIFGGRSAEHDVSIITGHTPIIQSLLASNQYEVWPVYITKDGSWYMDQVMNDLAFFQKPNFESQLEKMKKVTLSINNGLTLIVPGFTQKAVSIDLVFPAMHGTYGEDGSLMGLLRMANVPFVGCDMFASAVSMDKVITKQILSAENIPVVPYVWFTKTDWLNNKEVWKEKVTSLTWPLFVKPVHLGSSIGITKAKSEQELMNAIEVAFHYDTKVLIEESVENLVEVTLPIIGNENPQAALVERALNNSEFFDFSDKYLSGGKKGGGLSAQYSELPAKLAPGLYEEVEALGKKTYTTLGCEGIARIDFLIQGLTNKLFVNEVNTLPGSLYHHNWKKCGLTGVDLVSKLISFAEERHARDSKINVAFQSSILSKVGGAKM